MTRPTQPSWPPLRAFGTTNGVAARTAMALDIRPSWICVCFRRATSRNMRPKLHHGSEPGYGEGKLAQRTSHTKEDKDTSPPLEQRANTTSPCMALVALCRRIGVTPKALIRGCPRSCPCLEKKTDGRRVQVRSLSRCTTKVTIKRRDIHENRHHS